MSGFDLFDFNGSVKRNRQQEAMLTTLDSRTAFLERMEAERRARADGGKKMAAAGVIQTMWRGVNERKKARMEQRTIFDESINDTLENQIRRLAYFYENSVDAERLTIVCSSALRLDAKSLSIPLVLRTLLAKRAIFPFLISIDSSMNVTSVLRFLQVTTKESEWVKLAELGFFDALLLVFLTRSSTMEVEREEKVLPPHINSIYQMLLLPLSNPSSRILSIPYLISSLSRPMDTSSLTRLGLLLLPSLSSFLSSDLPSFTSSLSHLNHDPHSLLPFSLLLSILHLSPPSSPSLLPLLQSLPSFSPSPSFYSSFSSPLKSILESSLSSPLFISLYSSLPMQSIVPCLISLSSLSPSHSKSLSLLISHHSFLPSLFSVLCSPPLSLSSLSSGVLSSDGPIRSALIGGLSLFCRLLKSLLLFTDDTKLSRSHWNLCFSFKEIKNVLSMLRDVVLSLISIVNPDERLTGMEERRKTAEECQVLFDEVVSVLQCAHTKDERLEFLPSDFWSDHKKEISLTRKTLSSRTDRRGRRQGGHGGPSLQPFLQHLIDEAQSGSDSDSEEEMERERKVARMSAHEKRSLTIMRVVPFVVPFRHRVNMLKELIMEDKDKHSGKAMIDVSVRRTHLYEDALSDLSQKNASSLRVPLRVSMKNWAGMSEAGIDGGGIFREFLTEVVKEGLDINRGLFTHTNDHLLYPNPLAPLIFPDYRDHYFFLGRLLGKALYESQLLDVRLAPFFLSALFTNDKRDVDIVQMRCVDPIIYNNLLELREMDPAKIESLDLDFSVIVDELGRTMRVDLIPNGSTIRVDGSNRNEYIQKFVNFFLHDRLSPMLECLRNGVSDVVDSRWLAIFSSRELALLVCGEEGDIDVEDLVRHAHVHVPRGMQQDEVDRYMGMFWSILDSFSSSDRRSFVKFVTGCPRPPLGGFALLVPKMGIQVVPKAEDRLPTAATCMNLLKLPLYPDGKILEEKLRYAINAGAGFELS
ncbi:hypothetical protein PFISCL1PPCAC_6168 [Pristionchus fissidentatus]|uniref:HECT-type E3 ubiquitin transferase n=1 Tax=Pristionchus fissidentatus TaxID=1538716 RepID=A0AAV5V829_9BILA|nr:hypothetical protein PFISCL1PPCAC_6168 [Pristionchus fissidentatus]